MSSAAFVDACSCVSVFVHGSVLPMSICYVHLYLNVCVSASLHVSVLYHSGRLPTLATQSISTEYSDYIFYL